MFSLLVNRQAAGKSLGVSRDMRSSNESPPFFKEGHVCQKDKRGWFSGNASTASQFTLSHKFEVRQVLCEAFSPDNGNLFKFVQSKYHLLFSFFVPRNFKKITYRKFHNLNEVQNRRRNLRKKLTLAEAVL